ncbi:glycosyltransferase [Serratia sp. IR-2025]|nr:glycosyltransferase [Serratia marcescens]HED3793947.1 glycosyltransferase [Serratia marcescens]
MTENYDMSEIVYITLIDLDETSSGVAKKIVAQCRALIELGHNVTVFYKVQSGIKVWDLADNKTALVEKNNRKGILFYYNTIKLLKKERKIYDCSYIRLPFPSLNVVSYPLLYIFKRFFSRKQVIEIPTYPFLQESKSVKAFCYNTYMIFFSWLFNNKIDAISYMGALRKKIWGVRAVRVFNSVPMDNVPLKGNSAHAGINFIGVAQLSYWHGYDRIITGLSNYSKRNNGIPVFFHIVGNALSSNNDELKRLKELSERLSVDKQVIFHGAMSGKQLDTLFDGMDIAVDSLGRHRSGNHYNCSIKSKEYCARGIPFIKSHQDDSFDSTNYYYQCSADDSPVDIATIISWFQSGGHSREELRLYAESIFDWKIQLSKVINEIGVSKVS